MGKLPCPEAGRAGREQLYQDALLQFLGSLYHPACAGQRVLGVESICHGLFHRARAACSREMKFPRWICRMCPVVQRVCCLFLYLLEPSRVWEPLGGRSKAGCSHPPYPGKYAESQRPLAVCCRRTPACQIPPPVPPEMPPGKNPRGLDGPGLFPAASPSLERNQGLVLVELLGARGRWKLRSCSKRHPPACPCSLATLGAGSWEA